MCQSLTACMKSNLRGSAVRFPFSFFFFFLNEISGFDFGPEHFKGSGSGSGSFRLGSHAWCAYLEHGQLVLNRLELVPADIAAGPFGHGQPSFQAWPMNQAVRTDAIARRHQVFGIVLCKRHTRRNRLRFWAGAKGPLSRQLLRGSNLDYQIKFY